MGFLQQRPTPVGEPFDHVRLPQRPGSIHVAADDAGDLLGQLVGGTGRCQADVTHVVADVEVFVVDPVRTIEVERHLHELASQRLEMPGHQPVALGDLGERVETSRRPFVDAQ